MIKKFAIVWMTVIMLIALTACSSGGEKGDPATVETAGAGSGAQAQTASSGLQDDYSDALSVAGQLAVGTLQLEETELAVDEAQAAGLLPLWQALQALNASDTTAAAELDAVARQIEAAMTPAQITAIADMALTNDGLTELMESGELAFGGFGGRGGDAAQDEGFDPGQAPPGDFAGGLPPGGFPGGGPGGGAGGGPGGGFGAGPGGGLGAGGGAALDEDALATRQAQFAPDDGTVSDFLFTNMVIRLLQSKTGQVPADGRVAIFTELSRVISEETGLSVEEIQARAGEGQSLAEIISESGGNVTEIREAVIAALKALPETADQDVEQLVDFWLGLAVPPTPTSQS